MPAGWRTIVHRAWSNRGLGDFWQHCLVAEGSLEIACDSVMAIWDYAAARSARRGGGRPLHDLRPASPPRARALRDNGVLHDEAVALLST